MSGRQGWPSRHQLPSGGNAAQLAAGMGVTLLNPLTVGHETIPRAVANSASAVTLTSGSTRFTYFTARKSEPVTQVRTYSGSTAAAATPTLCRVGLYAVDGSGNLAQIAVTANTTTLWATASTEYLTAFSASGAIALGSRYAVAMLCVTAAAAPTIVSTSVPVGASANQDPRMSAVLTGQTDLQSSYTAGSLGTSGGLLYSVVLP